MNKAFVPIAALAACSACAGNKPMRKTLDQQTFEAAKVKCGLADASYFRGGFGITLASSQNSPNPEQRAKLDCMDRELADFDYHVVTETPPPQ